MKKFVSLIAAEDPTQTHHWLLPETAEIIYGGLATVIVVTLLVKFAGPMVKKSMADRTARIQAEIDNARESKTVADAEAAKIRTALGYISAERARILADADKQCEALIVEGRSRLEAEVRDMEVKAEADIAAAAARSGDELRAEIARLSAQAAERAVASALDDRAQQDLIESFISSVGAAR